MAHVVHTRQHLKKGFYHSVSDIQNFLHGDYEAQKARKLYENTSAYVRDNECLSIIIYLPICAYIHSPTHPAI